MDQLHWMKKHQTRHDVRFIKQRKRFTKKFPYLDKYMCIKISQRRVGIRWRTLDNHFDFKGQYLFILSIRLFKFICHLYRSHLRGRWTSMIGSSPCNRWTQRRDCSTTVKMNVKIKTQFNLRLTKTHN
jgi:hypothetical protein